MEDGSLDETFDVPGAHSPLQEVAQDWLEALADLPLVPPVVADDDSDRVVARSRYAELLRQATDAPPCLGNWEMGVVEADRCLAKTSIEPRRHSRHRRMLTEAHAAKWRGPQQEGVNWSSVSACNDRLQGHLAPPHL